MTGVVTVPVVCRTCGAHIHVTMRCTPGGIATDPDDIVMAELFATTHVGPCYVAVDPATHP